MTIVVKKKVFSFRMESFIQVLCGIRYRARPMKKTARPTAMLNDTGVWKYTTLATITNTRLETLSMACVRGLMFCSTETEAMLYVE